MIEQVICGFQTGADIAGVRAAKVARIPTGGWMPKGFLTEDGPRPEYAEMYGAKEYPSPKYPPRTKANIRDSDATLIFDTSLCRSLEDLSRGSQLATKMAMELNKFSLVIRAVLAEPPEPKRPRAVYDWFKDREFKIINIAGNRESSSPGIGAWVEAYLTEVFRLLREAP